jgi:hypothetical protein
VVVAPQCGSPTKTYAVILHRAQSQVCTLKNLVPNAASAALHPAFSSNTLAYYVEVNYDVASIAFNFRFDHQHSTAEMGGVAITSDNTPNIALEQNANTTVSLKVYAQDTSYFSIYIIKVHRAKAPVTNMQVIRGSLRDANCLLSVPNNCHLAQYFMLGVSVNASNPVDNRWANSTLTNSYGTFEIRLPFSDEAKGQTGFVYVNWPESSLRSNMHSGGMKIPYEMGAYSSAGQGHAYDFGADVGIIFWWPTAWTGQIGTMEGFVHNAITNKPLGYVEQASMFGGGYGGYGGYGGDGTSTPSTPAPTPPEEPATVNLYSSYADVLLATTTTDTETGEFRFENLEPGDYLVSVSSPNFFTVNYTHAAWNAKGVNVNLSPVIANNDIRVTMSWGHWPVAPKDMDLHVSFRPSADANCNVHFATPSCGYAHQDVDVIVGGQNGAETITIQRALPTIYTVYANNYNGDISPGSQGWRGRSQFDERDGVTLLTQPLQSDINEGTIYFGMDASLFDAVPATGYATETSGAEVTVYSKEGRLAKTRVPSHPEDPDSAHYYRDKPATAFDGGYRPESRYIRLLCMDFTGPSPKIYKVPQFSSTPPKTMTSCIT